MADFKWQNNGKLKLCIGLGTRPEIIRLAAVIRRCREYFDTCFIPAIPDQRKSLRKQALNLISAYK